MKTVKLSINSPTDGLLRQTPAGDGVWGDYKFEINNDVAECDFWVVYSKGQKFDENCSVAPENIILLTGEPEAIYHYAKGFVRQFPTVMTTRNDLKAPRLIKTQPAQPWWVGRKSGFSAQGKESFKLNFEDFRKPALKKTKLISVISSDKAFTKGHNERLKFVRELKAHFGDQLDVFGKGIKDFEDKWDILKDYKYHIALENSSLDHYWTEKLADSYLAGCFPFYYGAPNLKDYFDEGAFRSINITDIDSSIRVIEDGLESELYENSADQMETARNALLNKHNIFPLIADVCDTLDATRPRKTVEIKHEMSFLDPYKIPMIAKRLYYRHLRRP